MVSMAMGGALYTWNDGMFWVVVMVFNTEDVLLQVFQTLGQQGKLLGNRCHFLLQDSMA